MPDVTAPVVAMYSPTPGAPIEANDELRFRVTDDSGTFRRILVAVELTSLQMTELAFDGDVFTSPYLASTQVVVPNGFDFTIRRTGGWTTSPRVRVWAIDPSGNEA